LARIKTGGFRIWGHPALAAVADSTRIALTARIPAAQLDQFLGRFDPIVQSAVAP
jgi:hypothetical protein